MEIINRNIPVPQPQPQQNPLIEAIISLFTQSNPSGQRGLMPQQPVNNLKSGGMPMPQPQSVSPLQQAFQPAMAEAATVPIEPAQSQFNQNMVNAYLQRTDRPSLPPVTEPLSPNPSISPVEPPVDQSYGGFNVPAGMSRMLPPNARRDAEGNPGKETGFGSFLRAMGIPLLSAGVGLANPKMLAGAAGMGTGYVAGQQKANETELEREKISAAREKENAAPKPSFSQEQKIASIKAGLKRGKVTIGREFGEPSSYDINTIDDAYNAISDAGLDPSLFMDELSGLEEVIVLSPDNKVGSIPKNQLDSALKEGYKKVK